ncbi:hypothetical protein HK104_009587 [Borealophlyctis nickersoniae]|nr:hypothetical protein HK104_009587 [Borealophlyctis nickersoniae]
MLLPVPSPQSPAGAGFAWLWGPKSMQHEHMVAFELMDGLEDIDEACDKGEDDKDKDAEEKDGVSAGSANGSSPGS